MVVWGLRYILENYVMRQWTVEDVERADVFYRCDTLPAANVGRAAVGAEAAAVGTEAATVGSAAARACWHRARCVEAVHGFDVSHPAPWQHALAAAPTASCEQPEQQARSRG
jgi:hypothetical protein